MNHRPARRHPPHRLTLCALVGAALGAPSVPARAQVAPLAPSFALNRFEPSESGSEWFAGDTLDIRGNLRSALGVIADFAYKPYVLDNPDGSENTSIVTDQLFLHLGGSLVLFDRLRLGVSLPVAVVQDASATGGVAGGQRIVVGSGAGIGDLRFGADARLLGNVGDAFTLAFGARVWLPTGDTQKFLGDGEVRIGPHVAVAGDVGALAYAGSVGVVYRPNDAGFAGHPTGTEADFGLAVGARALGRKLLLGPELFGSTVLTSGSAIFGDRTTPLALLGGAHYTAGDFRFGLGAGPGLSHAAGTALFRALGSIEYAPGITETPLPPQVAPLSDRDADGVPDDEDACPDVPGVRTGDPKTSGCPSDRDKDGVVDAEDACPDVPGILTDDPKTSGCPSDRDKDGVADAEDACPDVPGARTDDPKTDGCPSDRDKDGIPDALDACPDAPGPASSSPGKNGCPLAFVKDDQIQITDQIQFRFGLADLDPVSGAILDAVLMVIKTHAEIGKIRIEGHTDNKGSAAHNQSLSDARAAAVASWLVKHGVDRSRLASIGYGLKMPIDTNDTDDGRAHNRRVEFHIEGEGTPRP
jgi:OmpA-OmpF porin, OOP family